MSRDTRLRGQTLGVRDQLRRKGTTHATMSSGGATCLSKAVAASNNSLLPELAAVFSMTSPSTYQGNDLTG
jgi:hypothetical protein